MSYIFYFKIVLFFFFCIFLLPGQFDGGNQIFVVKLNEKKLTSLEIKVIKVEVIYIIPEHYT